MYRSGDRPGKGDYYCDECYHMVSLVEDNEILPRCPVCDAVTFTKDEKPSAQEVQSGS